MNERTDIMPNDIVFHKPTGETWVVCGVNRDDGTLIPSGYPFPSIANISDCELVERGYEKELQSMEQINALISCGYPSYIDVKSAMFHEII